jgi:hypothetical protein
MFWSDRVGFQEYEGATWSNFGIPVNSTREPGNDGVSKLGLFGHKSSICLG